MKSKVKLFHEDDTKCELEPLSLIYDWNDRVQVFDTKINQVSNINFARISLFDHLLIVDGLRFRIANMLSKGEY